MSIASFDPTDQPHVNPKETLPKAQSDNYHSLTYDNNHTPLVSLLAYVSGAPWTVESYYRQVLGASNDLKPLDTSLSAVYQSYNQILNLEIRVQDELNGDTDQIKQFSSTTGGALVYGFVIPNVNDYFIATTSYNRKALFRVTDVDRLTWRRESVHGIKYLLVDYIDRLPEEVKDLKRKTTSTYVFSKDRLIENLSPMLKTEDYDAVCRLKESRKRIGDYYLNAFTFTSTRTLNLPGQPNERIYDSFLVDFVMSTFGFSEFPQTLKIKQLPKSGDTYLEQPQFWDAILKRDRTLIDFGNKYMQVARTISFPANTYIKSLFTARMDYIVYPWHPDTSTRSGEDLLPEPTVAIPIKQTVNANGVEVSVREKTVLLNGVPVMAYPKVAVNGPYVLTQSFYSEDDSQLTLLEILTRDYLKSATLDLKQLRFLVELYPRIERMEQFYFGPLLMTLLRYADQSAYS